MPVLNFYDGNCMHLRQLLQLVLVQKVERLQHCSLRLFK